MGRGLVSGNMLPVIFRGCGDSLALVRRHLEASFEPKVVRDVRDLLRSQSLYSILKIRDKEYRGKLDGRSGAGAVEALHQGWLVGLGRPNFCIGSRVKILLNDMLVEWRTGSFLESWMRVGAKCKI